MSIVNIEASIRAVRMEGVNLSRIKRTMTAASTAKIAAIVSDSGGVLSHAATVAREFMIPSVVGTGNATTEINTGDRIRVDGDNGVVTIL